MLGYEQTMSRLAVLKDELGRNIDHHTFVLKRYEDRLVELGREDAMQRQYLKEDMSGSVGGNRLGKKRERVENGEGMGKMQTGMSVSVVLQKNVRSVKNVVTHEAEYEQQKTEINKLYDKLQKEGEIMTKSRVQIGQKAVKNYSKLIKSGHKQSQPELTPQQKVLQDFGNHRILSSQDDIIMNLLTKLKEQQQLFVNNILKHNQLMIKSKVKQEIVRQTLKNQQILFKAKQESLKKSLNPINTNKQMVLNGYTDRMKELILTGKLRK